MAERIACCVAALQATYTYLDRASPGSVLEDGDGLGSSTGGAAVMACVTVTVAAGLASGAAQAANPRLNDRTTTPRRLMGITLAEHTDIDLRVPSPRHLAASPPGGVRAPCQGAPIASHRLHNRR